MKEIEELRREVAELKTAMEAILDACSDQQAILLQSLAHLQSALGALRDLQSKDGRDKPTLHRQMSTAYEFALLEYVRVLLSWKQSGRGNTPLKLPPVLPPDDASGN